MTLGMTLADLVPFIMVGCVLIAVACLFGLNELVKVVRNLKTNLAAEIRSELRDQAEPQPMSVQQPLGVKQVHDYVTKAEHEKFADQMGIEFGRERASRKGIYEKIESQGRDIVALKSETASQTRQLHQLDGKIDRILERMPRTTS